MRREGHIRGKLTSRSRPTGKCRRPQCRGCHTLPVTKSQGKAKGEFKTSIRNTTNLLHDWPASVKNHRPLPVWLKLGSPSSMWINCDYGFEDVSEWDEDFDGTEAGDEWDHDDIADLNFTDLVVSLLTALASRVLDVHPDAVFGAEKPPETLFSGSLEVFQDSEFEKVETGSQVMSDSDESWCVVLDTTHGTCAEGSDGDEEATQWYYV